MPATLAKAEAHDLLCVDAKGDTDTKRQPKGREGARRAQEQRKARLWLSSGAPCTIEEKAEAYVPQVSTACKLPDALTVAEEATTDTYPGLAMRCLKARQGKCNSRLCKQPR